MLPDYMTDDEYRYIDPIIATTLDHLTSRHPAFIAHERFTRDRLAELAHRAYTAGQSAARFDLYTTQQAAEQLGIAPRTVRQHAAAQSVGWHTGRDIILTAADIDVIRQRVGKGTRPTG